MAEAWRGIGRVTSVNPAKREVRVECSSHAAEGLLRAPWVLLTPLHAVEVKCKVESARNANGEVLLALVAGVPRDTVARLRLASVAIAPEWLPERPEGEWSPEDLEGMAVHTVDGEVIGTVLEVMESRANAILLVEDENGGRLLLPAVSELIARVLHREAVVVVNPIAPFAVREGEPEDTL